MTIVAGPSIKDTIQNNLMAFTRAERQLASYILSNYPVAALGSITALAKGATVSTPTVVRMVQKLGYKGYPDFQTGLRMEVGEMLISPLAKHDRWAGRAPDTHVLNRFADAVMDNLQATLARVDHAQFDAACDLLSDPQRRVMALGGRITHALADYFVTHMKVVRHNVSLMSEQSGAWPAALVDVRPGDVLVAFDIRRYENSVLAIAEMAVEQGAEIILFTDQWLSPAAELARYVFSANVEAPSSWDSTVSILVLLETLLASVETRTWAETEARMKRLEQLYDRARFFRKHR
ncbi:MAG: MurR/RpiR family transcriptional regulator [Paracoccaceae bacterium]|nr:MurR/RpiR family transcriptional regulator [Paracoccaceae bacterium]